MSTSQRMSSTKTGTLPFITSSKGQRLLIRGYQVYRCKLPRKQADKSIGSVLWPGARWLFTRTKITFIHIVARLNTSTNRISIWLKLHVFVNNCKAVSWMSWHLLVSPKWRILWELSSVTHALSVSYEISLIQTVSSRIKRWYFLPHY